MDRHLDFGTIKYIVANILTIACICVQIYAFNIAQKYAIAEHNEIDEIYNVKETAGANNTQHSIAQHSTAQHSTAQSTAKAARMVCVGCVRVRIFFGSAQTNLADCFRILCNFKTQHHRPNDMLSRKYSSPSVWVLFENSLRDSVTYLQLVFLFKREKGFWVPSETDKFPKSVGPLTAEVDRMKTFHDSNWQISDIISMPPIKNESQGNAVLGCEPVPGLEEEEALGLLT
uniref:Uncharacterized protein n=1 Tax=Glossina austeni TaxID=7395 RepID=A0A1A9VWJ0_GLOAU